MKSQQVDVLVIGSGIGGMCAAAYLSHKGYHHVKASISDAQILAFTGRLFERLRYKNLYCKINTVISRASATNKS